MNNFGVLYRYELKKLLSKRIVRISFLLCVMICALPWFLPLFAGYYVDGKNIGTVYEEDMTDRDYGRKLNGMEINQSLIEETIAAYRKIPYTQEVHYIATEEYQKYARPYSAIFNFIRRTSDMPTSEVMLSWQPSEEDLYAKRQVWLTSLWEEAGLSKGETDFWQEREEQIETPYVYEEHAGYDNMFSKYQSVAFFVLMLIAICLSGIFTDEHTRKTDQIVLCSPLGKTKLYLVKMAVGISFAAISAILFFVLTFIFMLCLYGAEGSKAAFQFMYAESSDPITCGQAIIIAYAQMVIAAVLTSVFVMALSEALKSNIATLAILSGVLMLSMIISVPEQYRVLRQIWNWLPWSFLSPWNVFSKYTICVFGHYFTPWQAVPMIYTVSGVIIAAVGKPIYQRFQVTGR